MLKLIFCIVLIVLYIDKRCAKIYSDDDKRPYKLIDEKGEEVALSEEQEAIEMFRKSIFVKDSFNASRGLALVHELSSMKAHDSLNMIASASLGNVPILHHLMNLYLLHKVKL